MNVYTVIYDDDSTMDEGYPMVFGIFSTFDKACAYAGSDGFERVTSDGCATADDADGDWMWRYAMNRDLIERAERLAKGGE